MNTLADLFPNGDYRFHLTLRRGEPQDFFRPHDASGKILAERARWLAAEPQRYAGKQPEADAVIAEFSELAAEWGILVPAQRGGLDIVSLGGQLEPDVLFLRFDDETKTFRLRGGALCFPTGWALEEKLGHDMNFIHGVVPGLNAALGPPIHQFLAKLKPGTAFLRDNWGLAATDELNLHPARQIAGPGLPVALDRLWLRVEHQALMALPRTGGIVFGIRIARHRLDRIADGDAARGLARALETMPRAVATYKRLDGIRAGVIQLLSIPKIR